MGWGGLPYREVEYHRVRGGTRGRDLGCRLLQGIFFFSGGVERGSDMDLNSTSCSSDDLVFSFYCDVRQCPACVLKNGWNGGIMFHDCNQGLSVCRWDGSVCRWDGSVCRMGRNGGILFHDYNQSLSGYRSKWRGQRYGIEYEQGSGLGL